MITTIENYYAPLWREHEHTCAACDWQGKAASMAMDAHREQSEYSCPHCECLLLVVVHPDRAQVQAAAAAGHPEALEQLALLDAFHAHRG